MSLIVATSVVLPVPVAVAVIAEPAALGGNVSTPAELVRHVTLTFGSRPFKVNWAVLLRHTLVAPANVAR